MTTKQELRNISNSLNQMLNEIESVGEANMSAYEIGVQVGMIVRDMYKEVEKLNSIAEKIVEPKPTIQGTQLRVYVIDKLKEFKQVIEKVTISSSLTGSMIFNIALKEDTNSNRSTVFAILDDDFIKLSDVYFQFYPESLNDRLVGELIEL